MTGIQKFATGQDQVFSWKQGVGIESVHIYIQVAGMRGFIYQQSGLTGTSHRPTEPLPAGNYSVWYRATLVNGKLTKWTDRIEYSVIENPEIEIANGIATWNVDENVSRYEIWINEIDATGRSLNTRVIHNTNVLTNSYDVSQLTNTLYRIWLRSITDTSDRPRRSPWSRGVDFGSSL